MAFEVTISDQTTALINKVKQSPKENPERDVTLDFRDIRISLQDADGIEVRSIKFNPVYPATADGSEEIGIKPAFVSDVRCDLSSFLAIKKARVFLTSEIGAWGRIPDEHSYQKN